MKKLYSEVTGDIRVNDRHSHSFWFEQMYAKNAYNPREFQLKWIRYNEQGLGKFEGQA